MQYQPDLHLACGLLGVASIFQAHANAALIPEGRYGQKLSSCFKYCRMPRDERAAANSSGAKHILGSHDVKCDWRRCFCVRK